MHIDDAKAKRLKIPEFNQGTLQYELIIRSNTTINTLGNFDLKKNIQAVQPQLVELCDVSQHLNACISKCLYVYNILYTIIRYFLYIDEHLYANVRINM